MHTEHALDLLLCELDDPQSGLSEQIEELVASNWPAWAEQCVRFVVGWEDDGYGVDSFERLECYPVVPERISEDLPDPTTPKP